MPSHDPMLGRTAVRPSWHELPADLRQALTGLLGAVHFADVQGGGFTPGVAARLRTDHGPVFMKAIQDTHLLASKYEAEAEAVAALPIGAPTPRLRWHGHLHGWTVLILTDVAGRHPNLSPRSPDVATTVEGVASLAKILTPNPLPSAPVAEASRGELLHGWAELQHGDPRALGRWERTNLERLAELESVWIPYAAGLSLVHGDIRPDNLLIRDGDGALVVVDWAQPSQGAAWQDVVDLIPHMIMAGHTPENAEKALVGVPAWEHACPDAITSYAAAYAGYWTRMSMQPPPPGVPNLRVYQARASQAAFAWTRHRLRG